MICCDQCGEWFHGECVHLTEAEGKVMVQDDVLYVCPQCWQLHDRDGEKQLLHKWHPNGPSLLFFPFPVNDSTKPWGCTCESCGTHCKGHYVTNMERLLELRDNGSVIRALPPSVLIEDAFCNGCTGDEDVVTLAKKCCLSTEDYTRAGHRESQKNKAEEQRRKKRKGR